MALHTLSRRTASAASLAAALALGSACADGTTGPNAVAVLEVTPALDTLRALGATVDLEAVARDAAGATVTGITVRWTSSNSAVVGVDSVTGLATAVQNGTAVISATSSTITATATIVVAQTVTAMTLAATRDTLTALGDSAVFTATATDARNNVIVGVAVVWGSADSAIATVSGNGGVTAKKNGVTSISAASGGVQASKTITVAQRVTAMTVTLDRDTLAAAGDTARATAAPVDANGHPVLGAASVWSSNDTTVARVDPLGNVVARARGIATIGATAGGILGSTQVVVSQLATQLTITTQPNGAAAGVSFATQPVVALKDARGNTITRDSTSVVIVTFALGGGTLLGATQVTASGGVATFTDLGIGGTVGPRRLLFTVTGGPAQTSDTVQLGAGLADTLVLVSGNQQIGPAGTNLPQPLSVRVTDAWTNNVGGASVRWSRTGGDGKVADSVTITGGSGTTNNTLTLGVHAGVNSAEAVIAGVPGPVVTFTATGTPNATISGTITTSSAFMSPPTASTPAPPASAPPPADYAPNELIVTYRPDAIAMPAGGAAALRAPGQAAAVRDRIQSALASHEAGGVLRVRGISPGIRAARVSLADARSLDSAVAALRSDPRVQSVERNGIAYHHGRRASQPLPTTSNDPLYPWQAWHYQMVDLPRAWDITTGSSSVIVAVVDDGIRFDHPEIAANLTTDGYDFVSALTLNPNNLCAGGTTNLAGDGDGYDPDPTHPGALFWTGSCYALSSSGNHGLHVGGTIGAVGNDATGVTGVAWTVKIRPVRVLGVVGFGTWYDIAQGVLYAAGLPADDGNLGTVTAPSAAHVINMSLGGSVGATVIQNAVQSATTAGVLIVASAGNARSSAPNYPAAYPEVLSVTALGPDGLLANYSSFGTTVDIAAPGGDLADGGCSFGVYSTTWNFTTGQPRHDCWHGTSMAAPHVSGVAALVLANEPSLTAAQLRARLEGFAVDRGAPGRDDIYGHGIVNARNAMTQTLEPPAAIFAKLYDAGTGALVATAPATPSGTYAFTGISDGSFHVFAGQDEGGDGTVGLPMRRWGARGGSAAPTPVTVDGAAVYNATFTIGLPTELEPNAVVAQASTLAMSGYQHGTLSTVSDVDMFRVRIATAGTYTFETGGPGGACGFALEANTTLTLYDGAGNSIATNADVDATNLNYCSRITQSLAVGTYFVGVTGSSVGRYTVRARAGM